MQGIDCVHGAKMQIAVGSPKLSSPPSNWSISQHNLHVRGPPTSKHLLVNPSPGTFHLSLGFDREPVWAVGATPTPRRLQLFRPALPWTLDPPSHHGHKPPLKKENSLCATQGPSMCTRSEVDTAQALNFLQWRYLRWTRTVAGEHGIGDNETRHSGMIDGLHSSTISRSTASVHPPLWRSTPLLLSFPPCLQYAVSRPPLPPFPPSPLPPSPPTGPVCLAQTEASALACS